MYDLLLQIKNKQTEQQKLFAAFFEKIFGNVKGQLNKLERAVTSRAVLVTRASGIEWSLR